MCVYSLCTMPRNNYDCFLLNVLVSYLTLLVVWPCNGSKMTTRIRQVCTCTCDEEEGAEREDWCVCVQVCVEEEDVSIEDEGM